MQGLLFKLYKKGIIPIPDYIKLLTIIGGRTSARRKPYKNDTRKLSNKTRSKRIYKYKAINSMQTSNG
jgi:hypothetical protein